MWVWKRGAEAGHGVNALKTPSDMAIEQLNNLMLRLAWSSLMLLLLETHKGKYSNTVLTMYKVENATIRC